MNDGWDVVAIEWDRDRQGYPEMAAAVFRRQVPDDGGLRDE